MLLGPDGLSRLGERHRQRGHVRRIRGRGEEFRACAPGVVVAVAAGAGVAFGSPAPDPEGFSHDMGAELVAFVARVVERTAERWPVL